MQYDVTYSEIHKGMISAFFTSLNPYIMPIYIMYAYTIHNKHNVLYHTVQF